MLIKKYQDVEQVNIDVVDIDSDSIELLKILLKKIKIPKNIKINFINRDFLTCNFNKKYDIVVGNPPFGKITNNKAKLMQYLQNNYNKKQIIFFLFL